MSRVAYLRAAQIVIDLAVLSVAFWLSFVLRFEGDIPLAYFKRAWLLWPYVVGAEYGIIVLSGVYRFSWRYVGLREASWLFSTAAASAALLAIVRIVAGVVRNHYSVIDYVLIPSGVIAINALLMFVGITGVRAFRRLTSERREIRRRSQRAQRRVRTLFIGAGQMGMTLAKEVRARPEGGVELIGFVDDDRAKRGTLIHGFPVIGTTAELSEIVERHGAEQALITINNAPGTKIRELAGLCHQAELQVKILPGIHELVGGQLTISRIRDVALEDLLRREPIVLDTVAISSALAGRVVLVTGAGGSIGSELCRQVAKFSPEKLLLVERAENVLFEIHRELVESYPSLDIVPVVADIGEAERMRTVLLRHRPEAIFHAAAHKHVPMMEYNPGEAVRNNILGTRRLADLAHELEVPAFVMISTDKAIRPTSVMGASKRIAEMYIQALSKHSATRFVTVRFGNVLGSTGSVVPIFKKQIEKGGPVTVTHPDMQRYFMTIPEASQLVLQAATMGKGGEIFILDMGEQVRIAQLAEDLIRLSGFQPGEIKIHYTGIRPGEKLFEELSTDDENASRTKHPKIFIGQTTTKEYAQISAEVSGLAEFVEGEAGVVRSQVARIVPECAFEERAPASAYPPSAIQEREGGSRRRGVG